MKILVVGSDKAYAIENYFVQYFRITGVETFHFPAQSMFYEYYQKNILHKILFKSGFSRILQRINNDFKKTVESSGANIIWIFKGMEIHKESLQWAHEKGVKLVNFNPDNPFIFSGEGSGNKNITQCIPLYDLHLTYNLEVKARLEEQFKLPTGYLPFGFDLTDDLFRICSEQDAIEKICFVGNPDPARAAFIVGLAEAGLGIDLYGNHWDRYVRHDLITTFKPIFGDDFWKVLRRYRVQLNLMRPHNENSHNMRSFEIPGVGGIMLAPDTTEHRLLFKNKEEVFLFSGLKDAIELAAKILTMSKNEAASIRQQARHASVVKKYTYKDRSEEVLAIFKRLCA